MSQLLIGYKHTRSISLYFFPFLDAANILLQADDNLKAYLALNYDYEKKIKNRWVIHIDVSLSLQEVADICTRSSFAVEAPEEHVFAVESLSAAVEHAIGICVQTFNENCIANHLGDPALSKDDFTSTVNGFTEGICEQYYNFRKEQEAAETKMKAKGLHLSPGILTQLTVMGTLKIIDEILFTSLHFNRLANQIVMREIVPLYYYNTLKLKSLAIKEKDVRYTIKDTIVLLMLIDAALQLLLGSRYQVQLEKSLKEAGFTDKNIDDYISHTLTMLKACKDNFRESGAQVKNLENPHDWNALIT